MKYQSINHIGINVNDLPAAKAFFLDFGMEVVAEWDAEGAWLDTIIGLDGSKTKAVMLKLPDAEGGVMIELVKFLTPSAEGGSQHLPSNTHGIRHIAIVVDDIEAIVDRLKEKGHELFSEPQTANAGEVTYKTCYSRGPEGIILELAQEIR